MATWLSEDEQRAWRRLGAVTMLLPAALESQLQRDAGVTHFGYWVLAMLSESPGRSRRMSELAALANGSQSRLSHLVAKLEERGWVRREKVGDDGRGFSAVLTDAGYDMVVATAPSHVAEVRRLVFDALSPEQVRALDAICAAIMSRLAECDESTELPG
ncbi:MAG TPA: MarR family winged helix-turn-helix transcriptional regulator [Micromonosporaceae bacterium]